VADPFIRFWFRFVFPYQADLAAGLRAADHYDRNVAPFLAEHAAQAFEDICRGWVRDRYSKTTDTVGPWWGAARHDLRRANHHPAVLQERLPKRADQGGVAPGRRRAHRSAEAAGPTYNRNLADHR
jgi:hypothetical protein